MPSHNSMELKLTLKNAGKIKEAFDSAPIVALKEFNTSLERIALNVVSEAQHNSPVGKYKGGGNLRQSIKYKPYGTGYVVWVNANYGIYVDQGTKPHVILPKKGRFLTFKGRDGNWVRTTRVNHPGTRATHFFTNAVKSAETYANSEMKNALGRIANKLNFE